MVILNTSNKMSMDRDSWCCMESKNFNKC